MSPIERLKLLGALRTARVSLSGAAGLAKLKAVKEIREIRTKLGVGVAPVANPAPVEPSQPAPQPTDTGAQAHLDVLAAVTAGQHDSQGLEPLYARIKAAVEGLQAAGALDANADAANAAITHWAELDLKLNG